MNTFHPLLERVLKLIEGKLPTRLRQAPVKPRRIEVQLEFGWVPKR